MCPKREPSPWCNTPYPSLKKGVKFGEILETPKKMQYNSKFSVFEKLVSSPEFQPVDTLCVHSSIFIKYCHPLKPIPDVWMYYTMRKSPIKFQLVKIRGLKVAIFFWSGKVEMNSPPLCIYLCLFGVKKTLEEGMLIKWNKNFHSIAGVLF